jgi:uncharacterized membrane protein
MKTNLRKIWDTLKSGYWFVPLAMMGLALILWWGTSSLDNIISTGEKKAIAWLYVSNADSMRTLLLTIAGAIIGIVGVVFSIIMVPLSIASSQFGSRLLRAFLRDTGTQITLGTFTATFIFCMAVLLRLSGQATQPLPQISVNVALLLGLISFAVLIYFINHVAISIQSPVLVARVSKELHSAIYHDLPDQLNEVSASSPNDSSSKTLADIALSDCMVMAEGSGYVQVRFDDRWMRLACQHNITLKLLSEPGDFVAKGTPLAIVWPSTDINKIDKLVNAAYVLSSIRTLVQDVTFGINELVEVAVRALSPAINDPFTAMTCLDWLGSAFCEMCTRTFPAAVLFDHNGKPRVIRNPVTFTCLADAAFNQIREYGRESMAVTLRLMETIKVVARCARTEEQRQSLFYHAQLTEQSCRIANRFPNTELILDCYDSIKGILKVRE